MHKPKPLHLTFWDCLPSPGKYLTKLMYVLILRILTVPTSTIPAPESRCLHNLGSYTIIPVRTLIFELPQPPYISSFHP